MFAKSTFCVIPGRERSSRTRNPCFSVLEAWIPGSPLCGAPE
jgi:hypothetical protein